MIKHSMIFLDILLFYINKHKTYMKNYLWILHISKKLKNNYCVMFKIILT